MAHASQIIPDVKLMRPEIDIFEGLTYDVSIENTTVATYYPLHPLDSKSSPIQFTIQGNDLHYLNLAESKLYIRAKIVDKDGADIAHNADKTVAAYAPINNLLHSMFKNVSLHLNDVEVTPKTGHYPYRAYIETLIAKGKDYKKSQANAAMYYKTKDEGSTTDDGWKARMNRVDRSAVFEMIGRPHLDMLQQNKFIPPTVDVKLTFFKADNAFAIQTAGTAAPTDLQLKILEAEFHVVKHTIQPSEMVKQLKRWETGVPATYPLREVQMKSYSLPIGTQSHNNESLISGFLPDRIVIGLVDAAHIHGTYPSNPLVFKDYNLSNITVTCSSEEVTSFNMDVDFQDARSVRAYSALFDGLGLSNCDSGIELTMDEFTSSKALFVYDLRHLRGAFATPRHGNVMISLKFKAALPQAITVMTYLEYQSVLHINSDRQVYFRDFSRSF